MVMFDIPLTLTKALMFLCRVYSFGGLCLYLKPSLLTNKALSCLLVLSLVHLYHERNVITALTVAAQRFCDAIQPLIYVAYHGTV